jgi:hypothetical protein
MNLVTVSVSKARLSSLNHLTKAKLRMKNGRGIYGRFGGPAS